MSAFADTFKRLSNWGRWGDDDERGTVNLIDAAAVRRGAEAVRDGRSFSLALPLDQDGPQIGLVPGRINPLRTMIAINAPWSDDMVVMALQAATHWDGLAHISHEGQLYNGFPATTVTENGAARCGIDKLGPVVTRGILLDVARARGVERLDPGTAVGPDDLDAACELGGVTPEAGDVVLVRTGQVQLLYERKRKDYALSSAGLSADTPEWFFERDVAAVATDNLSFEVMDPEPEDGPFLPVHVLHLVAMGLTQGQNFDLEALAADCTADGRYTFLLEASPQPFTGGLGSPVNPVATK